MSCRINPPFSALRVACAVTACALCVVIMPAHVQGADEIDFAKVTDLVSALRSKLQKFSVHFEQRGLMHPDNNPYLYATDLAWEPTSNHFHCRTVQFADIEGLEPRHVVINTWDGKEAVYWTRYVDKERSGKGMNGKEPVDPGVVIRFSQARTGNFFMLQEILFPDLYGPLKKEETRVEIRPHGLTGNLPEGATAHLISKHKHLIVHLPTGWILRLTLIEEGKEWVDLQASEFVKIPNTSLIFPTKLLRTTNVDSSGENVCLLTIDPASIKVGDAVSIAEPDFPPGVHFQKEQ